MAGRLPTPQRAFTLVEMLVVLILVGLLSGILIGALEQTMRLERRSGLQLAESEQGAMQLDWFRQSIEGLLPVYPNDAGRFAGSPRSLAGLSTGPLSAEYGAPTQIAWRIEFDSDSGRSRLLYGTGDAGAVVLSWPGDTGKFVYIDAQGEAHDSWPPPLGLWPQLPELVLLETGRADVAPVIAAAPMGPRTTLPRPGALFGAAQQ